MRFIGRKYNLNRRGNQKSLINVNYFPPPEPVTAPPSRSNGIADGQAICSAGTKGFLLLGQMSEFGIFWPIFPKLPRHSLFVDPGAV
jgi:hypothetical protein